MNDSFIESYMMSADMELYGGYHMEYLSEDQWKVYDNKGTWVETGTLEECCMAYRMHWQKEVRRG